MYNIINGDGAKTQENLKSFYGGTIVYQGAQNDDWIISLAKFGVTALNEKTQVHDP